MQNIGVRHPARSLAIATALVWLGCASLPQFFGQSGDAGQSNDSGFEDRSSPDPSDAATSPDALRADSAADAATCKRVFIRSSMNTNGDFAQDGGAHDIADALCTAAAGSGTWRALIRVDGEIDLAAYSRVAPTAGPWCNLRYQLLFSAEANKTNWPPATTQSLLTTEDGGSLIAAQLAWTGLGQGGNCLNWTSSSTNGAYGQILADKLSPNWAILSTAGCNTGMSLLCFEQ